MNLARLLLATIVSASALAVTDCTKVASAPGGDRRVRYVPISFDAGGLIQLDARPPWTAGRRPTRSPATRSS